MDRESWHAIKDLKPVIPGSQGQATGCFYVFDVLSSLCLGLLSVSVLSVYMYCSWAPSALLIFSKNIFNFSIFCAYSTIAF